MRNERWRNLLRRFITYDIPDDMAACFGCDEMRCSDERFATCSDRIVRAVAEASEPANRSASTKGQSGGAGTPCQNRNCGGAGPV
jgi:hypothetical protein